MVDVELGQGEEEVLLLEQEEVVGFEEVRGVLYDHEEVVQGLLEVFDEVVQRVLVDEVFEEVQGLLEVFDDAVQRVLVEDVFEDVQGFEVVLEQEVDVDFDLVQLVVVEHFLDEVLEVHGLVDDVVQCLLLEVVQGVEQEVLVQVVAGV